jgi:hypothetical protein
LYFLSVFLYALWLISYLPFIHLHRCSHIKTTSNSGLWNVWFIPEVVIVLDLCSRLFTWDMSVECMILNLHKFKISTEFHWNTTCKRSNLYIEINTIEHHILLTNLVSARGVLFVCELCPYRDDWIFFIFLPSSCLITVMNEIIKTFSSFQILWMFEASFQNPV